MFATILHILNWLNIFNLLGYKIHLNFDFCSAIPIIFLPILVLDLSAFSQCLLIFILKFLLFLQSLVLFCRAYDN